MFDKLEERVNSAALNRLSNAKAVIGALAVDGIFSNGYMQGDIGSVGFDASDPQFVCSTDDVSMLDKTEPILIEYKGTTTEYEITNTQPDGIGFTRLILKTT